MHEQAAKQRADEEAMRQQEEQQRQDAAKLAELNRQREQAAALKAEQERKELAILEANKGGRDRSTSPRRAPPVTGEQ